jgi:hypothetical protein
MFMHTRFSVATVTGVLACAALLLGACSSGDDGASSASTTTTPPSSSTTQPRPAGPAADMTTELTGGNGVFMGEAVSPDLDAMGYVQREYEATGEATAYKTVGELGGDGRWKLAPTTKAPYRTRVAVRAPADPSKFSGTVVVEWLNVSGGVDADPDWTSTEEEIVRSGDVWVGVSAQNIGVEGGPVIVKVEGVPGAEAAGKGLKKVDPVRYGDLEHPGDPYALDIYTQVARAVRAGAGMEGMEPERLIAAGESQSAFALVSYYDGVQPITKAFDGFFVHSRGGGALPLVDAGENSGIADALRGKPTIFRTDADEPVLDIQTESDVTSILNSYVARQDDSGTFRLWEVAGTAHADAHLVGEDNLQYIQCGVPVNDGPMHIVAKAALHALKEWVATGTAPPIAPRLEVTADPLAAQRDTDAIALGGIRTPPVDVPVTSLSGAPGPNPSAICLLLGSSKPLSDARIAELYSSRDDYEKQFEAAADEAIAAGFVLDADRDALLAFAEPDRVAG